MTTMRIALAACLLTFTASALEAATMSKLLGFSESIDDVSYQTTFIPDVDINTLEGNSGSGNAGGNSKSAGGSGGGAIVSNNTCGQPTFSSCPSVPTCGLGSINRGSGGSNSGSNGGGSSSGGCQVPINVNVNVTIEVNINIDITTDFNRPKASPSGCF